MLASFGCGRERKRLRGLKERKGERTNKQKTEGLGKKTKWNKEIKKVGKKQETIKETSEQINRDREEKKELRKEMKERMKAIYYFDTE